MRKSIIVAFAIITVYFSFSVPAHSVDTADAAFTQQTHSNQQRQNRSIPRSRLFEGKSSHNGSGSGPDKPDDFDSNSELDGLPKFPKSESVEQTWKHLDYIKQQTKKLDQILNEDQCPVDSKAGFIELPNSKNFVYKYIKLIRVVD